MEGGKKKQLFSVQLAELFNEAKTWTRNEILLSEKDGRFDADDIMAWKWE